MAKRRITRRAAGAQKLSRLPVDDIVPDPNQPRKTFTTEGLKSLAESFAGSGPTSPIVVRPTSDGKYMVVVGERRLRAARDANLSHIDCIIRHDLDDQRTLELQLAENSQREDVPPLEQARALKSYLDRHKLSQRELERRTGIPQRTISARLALLELPVSMHAKIECGEIGPHEAILICELPPDHQGLVTTLVASGKLGGRALERLCALSKANPQTPIDELINQMEPTSDSPSTQSSEVQVSDGTTPVVRSGKKDSHLSVNEIQDIKDLLDAVKWLGAMHRSECDYLVEDNICTLWKFDKEEQWPNWAAKGVVRREPDSLLVEPSDLLCGLCCGETTYLALTASERLEGDPLAGLGYTFKCKCGAEGEVAAYIKCAKCGAECWQSCQD
ncbi:MAG: ParB/RepB/Spo0J family partition protein [Dehalococcoidia bacterium]|jgi:ParB family chromosome partitioning protein